MTFFCIDQYSVMYKLPQGALMTAQTPHFAGDELYAAYASGRLDQGFVLLLETQAALRPDISRSLRRADAIGGLMLERESKSPMSFGALDRAMKALDGIEAPVREACRRAQSGLGELIRLPRPLQDFALDAASQRGWSSAGRGLSIMKLDVESDTECELLRIEPGCGAPQHTHDGNEFTLVITGQFSDGRGTYRPGDISIAGPDDVHRPIADEGEICLALAVRDGGLRFTGMLGLIQRVLGR